MEKPWNDVADQQRSVDPDHDAAEGELASTEDGPARDVDPTDVLEANPADVADQNRVVPLHEDDDVPPFEDHPRP
ncbi:hypothetical protein ACTG9Q_05835 [Actinokineospora sp. 24-640]